MFFNKYANVNLSLIIILSFFLSFCSSPVESESNEYSANDLIKQFESISMSDLSQEEIEGILFMREEEKLARDFYTVMYEKWGNRIFNNIANSEQNHMNAIKLLIDRYELEDPIVDDIAGEFQNVDLQNLFSSLMEMGNSSLLEALKAGAIIEETDILDLKEHIADVDSEDITLVYNNLLNGSKNHLRAFVRNIEVQGEIYTPNYLSEEEYNEIITSENQMGNKNKKKGWGRSRN